MNANTHTIGGYTPSADFGFYAQSTIGGQESYMGIAYRDAANAITTFRSSTMPGRLITSPQQMDFISTGGLSVAGLSVLSSSLSVAKVSVFASTLSVGSDTVLSSHLSVAKLAVLSSSLSVAKVAVFASTLRVGNDTVFASTLSVGGSTVLLSHLSVA